MGCSEFAAQVRAQGRGGHVELTAQDRLQALDEFAARHQLL
jgi:hypothetical protein